MGKGDSKTTKGKRFRSSFGKTRRRKESQTSFIPDQAKPKTKDVAMESTKADAPKAEKKAPKKAAKSTTAAAKKTTAKKPVAKKAAAKTTTKKADEKEPKGS